MLPGTLVVQSFSGSHIKNSSGWGWITFNGAWAYELITRITWLMVTSAQVIELKHRPTSCPITITRKYKLKRKGKNVIKMWPWSMWSVLPQPLYEGVTIENYIAAINFIHLDRLIPRFYPMDIYSKKIQAYQPLHNYTIKLECGPWYHPRRLQCVLSRVATWHYRRRHNLKNNCIWDNLQCCLLVPRSPSKPVMLTFDLQSRKVIFIEIVFWHV